MRIPSKSNNAIKTDSQVIVFECGIHIHIHVAGWLIKMFTETSEPFLNSICLVNIDCENELLVVCGTKQWYITLLLLLM